MYIRLPSIFLEPSDSSSRHLLFLLSAFLISFLLISSGAGCNLLSQTPEIANWIASVEKDKPVTVGGYAYLDGALFVKVLLLPLCPFFPFPSFAHSQLALAMDAIMKGVYENRKNVTLAFLCTSLLPSHCSDSF